MTKYYNDNRFQGYSGLSGKPKKPGIIALRIVAWIFTGVVLLVAGAFCVISLYLTPGRVAKIISEQSEKYIDGKIEVAKVGYSVIRSFPWLNLEVDSLTVVSKSLDNLPPQVFSELPEDASELAFVGKLKVKLNIKELFENEIEFKDLEITDIRANIVMVNDSVSNFNLFPRQLKPIKMPEIKEGDIKLEAPIDLTYFYLPDTISAKLAINSFNVKGSKKKKTFDLGVNGSFSGSYKELVLPRTIDFNFKAEGSYALKPVGIKLQQMALDLGFLKIDMSGALETVSNNIRINSFESIFTIPDLFSLTEEIPEKVRGNIPFPDGLNGNLPVKLSLELKESFLIPESQELLLENLPVVAACLEVKDANLSYRPPKGEEVVANDITIDCETLYDSKSPDHSYLHIKELKMDGEGIYLWGHANIESMLSDSPDVKVDLRFRSTLMKSLSYLLPESGIKLGGHLEGEVNIGARPLNLGRDGARDISLSGSLKSKNLTFNSGKGGPDIKVTEMKAEYSGKLPAYPTASYSGVEMDLNFKTGNLSVSEGKRTNLLTEGLNLNFEIEKGTANAAQPNGMLSVMADTFKGEVGEEKIRGAELKFDLKGGLLAMPKSGSPSFSLPVIKDDSIIASRHPHTPVYLLASDGGGMISTFMSMADVDADLIIGKAEFITPAYLLPFSLNNLSVNTDLNRFLINSATVTIGESSLNMTGNLEGLYGFLTSYNPTLLKADLNIDFTNVNINELSGAYYGAQYKTIGDSAFYIPPLKPFTAADSTAVLIPRNIEAVIRLNSIAAEYMDYRFSPLSTSILLKDGDATLSRLTIGAPYTNLIVDWTYSTRSLDNVYMNLHADVKEFTFKSFFNVFPGLAAKSPYIKDISGRINASVDGSFLLYPSMFMNFPSAKAEFNILGEDLQFAREGRVERLTHLMRIEGDEPIRLANLDITGSFHDNLLELNPFKIKFDDYQIGVAGVNNMKGEMYYHVALEKSPFHLPFGVNLVGKFDHPEVRLGGTGINDGREREISSELEDNVDVNIMASLKQGWQMFIQEAAKYYLNGGRKQNPVNNCAITGKKDE